MTSTGPGRGAPDAHRNAPHDHPHTEAELHGGPAGADHHRHTGGHGHDHGHPHDHAHEHRHDHEHLHQDGTRHAHRHGHTHAHAHGHDHSHDHDHEHSHDHGHAHPHGHDHDHGDLATAVRRLIAERRALAVALAEFPGGRGALLAESLARRLHGKVPTAIVGPATVPPPDIVLRGVFEDGIDAHHLLHALDGEAVPHEGLVLVREAAFAPGEPAGLDHRIVALHVATGEDAGPTYAMALAGAALVVVTGVEHAGTLGVSIQAMLEGLRTNVPGAGIVPVDLATGAGFERIVEWLVAARALKLSAL